MAEASNRGPLTERNRLIKENRVADYTSPNLALGMAPVEFGAGTSRWVWRAQPPVALNPFGTLQGGYLILAARALGLDTGPMSGFDNEGVDKAFFAGTSVKSNFLCNLGYGDWAGVMPRSPRFTFAEMAKIA